MRVIPPELGRAMAIEQSVIGSGKRWSRPSSFGCGGESDDSIAKRPLHIIGRPYDALRTRAIDGADLEFLPYVSSRYYDHAKYYSLTEHSFTPSVLIFSHLIWDKLPRGDQAIIKNAARESLPYFYRLWDEREIEAQRGLENAGAHIITDVDRTSLADALSPPYLTVVTDGRVQNWLANIRAAEAR